MSTKPTSANENTRIYYILDIVNLLHVSVNFFYLLQGGVLRKVYYKDVQTEQYHHT